ncbi:hypothetical protein ACOSQ3_031058 [Xanthoceras sorbifolium]
MDSKLFKAFRRRDVYQINKLAGVNPHIFRGKSPQGNTALHLAARLRDKHVVEMILSLESSFLYEKNRNGETPMHIAAKAGNAYVIEVFIVCYNNRIVSEGGQENILEMKDNNGNIPLHTAVQNHRDLAAVLLMNKGPETILLENDAKQSALSIAIDTSSTYIAWVLMKEHPSSLDYRRHSTLTLLHCAVIRQNYVFVVEIVKRKGELINTLDVQGRNPLHYAAALGNVAIARRLLQADGSSSLGHKSDCNGQTPLHLAAQSGRERVLSMLVNGYPDAIEVLDGRQRSILHLAALNGNVNTVKFIITLPEMEDLINSTDGDGNTPLHLASMNFQEKVVDILSKNERVNIRATNQNQLTALAIVESSTDPDREIQKYLIAEILKEAFAARAFYPEDILESRHFNGIVSDSIKKIKQEEKKEMAQTLLLIATLVATFTFTSAFTIPGGYKNDGPDEGMATLVRKSGFQAFVITVTVGMASSMTAAVLALGQIRYRNHKRLVNINLIPLAIRLIWLGLVSMSLAFVTGLFVVLSDNLTLAIVVCSIGCSFPAIIYFFGPFFGVQTDKIHFLNTLFLFSSLKYFPQWEMQFIKLAWLELHYHWKSARLRRYDKHVNFLLKSGLYRHQRLWSFLPNKIYQYFNLRN